MKKNNLPVIFTEPVKKVKAELFEDGLFIPMLKPKGKLAVESDQNSVLGFKLKNDRYVFGNIELNQKEPKCKKPAKAKP